MYTKQTVYGNPSRGKTHFLLDSCKAFCKILHDDALFLQGSCKILRGLCYSCKILERDVLPLILQDFCKRLPDLELSSMQIRWFDNFLKSTNKLFQVKKPSIHTFQVRMQLAISLFSTEFFRIRLFLLFRTFNFSFQRHWRSQKRKINRATFELTLFWRLWWSSLLLLHIWVIIVIPASLASSFSFLRFCRHSSLLRLCHHHCHSCASNVVIFFLASSPSWQSIFPIYHQHRHS